VGLVAVTEHAQVISHPERHCVAEPVALQPRRVPRHVVEVELVHVFYHPLSTLAVGVVPGAVASTFFRPNVYHLSSEVKRVG